MEMEVQQATYQEAYPSDEDSKQEVSFGNSQYSQYSTNSQSENPSDSETDHKSEDGSEGEVLSQEHKNPVEQEANDYQD